MSKVIVEQGRRYRLRHPALATIEIQDRRSEADIRALLQRLHQLPRGSDRFPSTLAEDSKMP